jgi:cytochrome c peroxidase
LIFDSREIHSAKRLYLSKSSLYNQIPVKRKLLGFVLLVTIVFLSCKKDDDNGLVSASNPVLPAVPYSYAIPDLPPHFDLGGLPFFAFEPDDNPITDAGATLGRVLFYDKNLSYNLTTSCGSCHHQEHGFADYIAASKGHSGGQTRRNASHLVNQRFNRRQFWDQRAATLEVQVLMPLQDDLEMGMTLDQVVYRLQSLDYYHELFSSAFGSEEITSDKVSRALSQFVRSIVSYQTKYDEGVPLDFSNYSQIELDGKDIFFNGTTRCNQCHMTANFYTPQAFNDGLDVEYEDNGRGEITGNVADNGRFKVPMLRNVELTSPYMHDGRFNTLEEVVEHYNSGLQPHPNIEDRLTVENQIGGTPYQLNLTEYQKSALVAFLKTLTDHVLLDDPRFSDPFVR